MPPAKGESWYVAEFIIMVFFCGFVVGRGPGWGGQHQHVGGSELESETYRGVDTSKYYSVCNL